MTPVFVLFSLRPTPALPAPEVTEECSWYGFVSVRCSPCLCVSVVDLVVGGEPNILAQAPNLTAMSAPDSHPDIAAAATALAVSQPTAIPNLTASA